MSDEHLAEIRARWAAATVGPYEQAEGHSYTDGKVTATEVFIRRPEDDVAIAADILDPNNCMPSPANGAFLANSWADVAYLLGEVDRLNALLGAPAATAAEAGVQVLEFSTGEVD